LDREVARRRRFWGGTRLFHVLLDQFLFCCFARTLIRIVDERRPSDRESNTLGNALDPFEKLAECLEFIGLWHLGPCLCPQSRTQRFQLVKVPVRNHSGIHFIVGGATREQQVPHSLSEEEC